MSLTRSQLLFAIVVLAAATAWVLPFRQPNCNTGSHYALVQSLAEGSKTIDSVHGQSCDISWWHGHYYANKAPGLALVTVPWYLLLHSAGALHADRLAAAPFPQAMRALPRRDLWLMGLWGAVLPALGLLVLVRREAERLVPGAGAAAAALLAFGTILLPFGGLFFSHALSALLDFAAFTLAIRRPSVPRVAAAGALAGAAVVVEYPNVIVVVVLACVVAATATRRLPAVLAYVLAAAAGVTPLLVYDWWAFDSPLHLSYVGAVLVPGPSGHDVLGANASGFFGVGVPSASRLVALLFSDKGLLVGAPVLALAPLGLVCLWRVGRRRWALAAGAMTAAFLVYNAGYYSPLGGATPGPRFLIPALPFLVIAVVAAIPRVPRTAAVLTAAGAVVLLAADATQPLIGRSYTALAWWHWVRAGSFTSTVLDPHAHGARAPVALGLVAVVGVGAGLLSLRPPAGRRAPVVPAAREGEPAEVASALQHAP